MSAHCHIESEALKRASDSNNDANNNACGERMRSTSTSLTTFSLSQVDAKQSYQACDGKALEPQSRSTQARQSELVGLEDWHLLDVDRGTSSSSSSSSLLLAMGESSCKRVHECGPLSAPRRQSDSLAEQRRQQRERSNTVSLSRNVQRTTNLREINKNKGSKSNDSTKFIVVDNHEFCKNCNRILENLCAAIYSLMPLASLLVFATLIYLLLFTKLWFITLIYYSYLLLDSKTCNRGGRRWDWVHKARFWSYLAAYFPIRLRYSRKFELKSNENYILNYHPHGIGALGCVCCFATDALGFSKLFPGIKSRFMVHETSFLVPVMRETFGFRGDCSVNSASFDYILSQKWKQQQQLAMADGGSGGSNVPAATAATGNLLALCGGGLAEADQSDMQTLKIVCATRKGFVKKALIHGAHLVPCLAFGENSIFKKVNLQPGSLLHRLETKWYQLFKFKHPIYYGWFGTMPFKRPITVCMGDPIEVERVAEPSQEQIDHVHSLYIERLRALYEENQDLCVEYDLKFDIL